MAIGDPVAAMASFEAINAGLQSLKAGHSTVGKVVVIVDLDLAREK
jgi:hypothetical protein